MYSYILELVELRNNLHPMDENTKYEIKAAVKSAMAPVYWLGGSVLAIFISVTGPMTNKMFELQEKVHGKADYENVINKYQYQSLVEEQHRYDIEAINNPENAKDIYDSHSYKLTKDLKIGFRNSE